ncbi:hypothetical protein CTEN210_12062 [Chaetoceros tenuissimus]|uniref:Uncharacterized protein n=1 Tax=Chaetoceros tenuissimus TaxID=426638 RepID=A0AAD3D0H5_9STRA|nr:hypothetical protein CTEN210_12062 [Chaetoceros tenuissimus]
MFQYQQTSEEQADGESPSHSSCSSKENNTHKKQTKQTTKQVKQVRSAWSAREDYKLYNLIQKHGTKWHTISTHFHNRNASKCRDRWRKCLLLNLQQDWSQDEDILLEKFVQEKRKWNEIGRALQKTDYQVKHRFIKKLQKKCKLKHIESLEEDESESECERQEQDHRGLCPRGGYKRWTPEEDELLRQAVLEYTNQGKVIDYQEVAKKIPGTIWSQCQSRWVGTLKHTSFEPWTDGEDEKLEQLVDKYGSIKKWSKIALEMKGRMPTQCRQRWKQKHGDDCVGADDESHGDVEACASSPSPPPQPPHAHRFFSFQFTPHQNGVVLGFRNPLVTPGKRSLLQVTDHDEILLKKKRCSAFCTEKCCNF